MLASSKLYYENVRVGEELPLHTWAPIERVDIARYVGAIEDYNPYYVDEDYARRCGFPSVCAPSSMALDLLAQLGSAWLRQDHIRRISGRFVKILWPGDQLIARARILDKRREGGECYVDMEVWAENQRGDCVVKGALSSKVFHSAEDEERQRRGLSPLVFHEEQQPSLVEVFEREMPLGPVNTVRQVAEESSFSLFAAPAGGIPKSP